MRFKAGVVTYGWGPEIERALSLADAVSWRVLGREGHVTSGREGNHSDNSLHYWRWARKPPSAGAFDLRIWRTHSTPMLLPLAKRQEYRDALAEALGPDWDVVLEATHIHAEHDP